MKKLLSLLLSVVTCLSICASCTSLKHEHITGSWEYNETQHWRGITCTWNQCLFDLLFEDHVDNDGNGECDVCGYGLSVDIPPTNYFLRNQAGAEWLQAVTADDIAEIKIISEEGMVAYGCFKDVASSNDQATIEKMLEKYYWLDMWPVDEKDTIIMDGGVVTVEFIMDNGAINRLTFNNGDFYVDANGKHFELLYLPMFDYTPVYTSYKEFITRTGKGAICQLLGDTNLEVEPVLLGEIPMDEIKFIPVDISFGVGVFTPTYGIETDFGFLTFMDKEIFYINGQPNYYYQLVGKNLDELIDEYCAD